MRRAFFRALTRTLDIGDRRSDWQYELIDRLIVGNNGGELTRRSEASALRYVLEYVNRSPVFSTSYGL
ncbi:MAG: hypothetical protein HY674_14680 [Chloroflexi bacterium]|nr:hypothetical protein [Chloroflexota bacterium]